MSADSIEVFSTCVQSADFPREEFVQRVQDVARWSEAAGCRGILVYTDNRLVDPWLVAQVILQSTEHLCPLVAVQPLYMHPYTVANLVSSLAHMYGRRVYLNLVAGGFMFDLRALCDSTPHDRRYERLREYASIVQELLLRSGARIPLSFKGEFYTVENLKLTPALPEGLAPGIFLSGSSDAGMAAARALKATAIQYPKPLSEYDRDPPPTDLDIGIRIGIVARASEDEAWQTAHRRFPVDRKGQVAHQMAMKVSDSVWHRQLSRLGKAGNGSDPPYWMQPFENHQTFCPYLVGTYERVAREVAAYARVGYRTVILDIPRTEEELEHIRAVFSLAEAEAARKETIAHTESPAP